MSEYKNIKNKLSSMNLISQLTIEKSMLNILEYIEKLQQDIINERKKVEEYNKDEEIQKLIMKINELKKDLNTKQDFIIYASEKEEIDKWIETHINEKHNGDHYAGAIGGRFSYEFIPTSIGIIGTVKCSCGESFTFRELF